jgi:hypothetical protein
MQTCNSNVHISIYEMGDTPAFMLNEDAPLLTCTSLYLCNWRHVVGTHISLLSQKRARLGY